MAIFELFTKKQINLKTVDLKTFTIDHIPCAHTPPSTTTPITVHKLCKFCNNFMLYHAHKRCGFQQF